MPRTISDPEGVVTVRALRRGEKSPLGVSKRAAWTAAAGPILIGLASAVRLGWQMSLLLVGVTALITVPAAISYQRSLHRRVALTIAPDRLTFRNFWRTRSVERDEQTQVSVVLMEQGHGLPHSPYLVCHRNGSGFAVNLALFTAAGLETVTEAVEPTYHRGGEPTKGKQLARDFPATFPFWIKRPILSSFAFIAAAVVVVVLVGLLVSAVADSAAGDDPVGLERDETPPDSVPTSVTEPQRQLLDDLMAVAASPESVWSTPENSIQPCEGAEGWLQQTSVRTSESALAESQDVVDQLVSIGTAAGFALYESTLEPDDYDVIFSAPERGLAIIASSSLEQVRIVVRSACAAG